MAVTDDGTNWWNYNWKSRRKLGTPNPSGGPYTADIHFLHFDLDLQSLIDAGKLESDYADLRIVFTSGSPATHTQVPYHITSQRSPERIFFPAQNDIPSGLDISEQSDWAYYLYYNSASGDIEAQPPAYANYNFPQAPYSATTDWYITPNAESGFRDKFLYRFNDDPSEGSPSGFIDATSFTSGVANPAVPNCITKGHDGRLDTATYFTSTAGTRLKVLDQTDAQITYPSGSFCLDAWVKPDTVANTYRYIFFKYRNGANLLICRAYNDNAQTYYYYTTTTLNISADIDALFTAGEWTHIRFAYRTNLGSDSCVSIYTDGVYRGKTAAQKTHSSKMYDLNPLDYIGGRDSATQQGFQGYMEEVRWSTYPEFASGVYQYHVPPDWVETEYEVEVSAETTRESTDGLVGGYAYGLPAPITTSGIIGGFLSSTGAGSTSGTIGGFLYSDATTHDPGTIGGFVFGNARDNLTYIGGFINALPLEERSATIGGYILSYAGISTAAIGGMSIGTWNVADNSVVDGLARTLVKAVDDETIGQTFSADSQFVIYAATTDNFDASLTVADTDNRSFDAALEIYKIKKNPYIEIISTDIVGNNPWTVTITASGHAFDANNNIIASGIQKADFIWTDGNISYLTNVAQSGYIFSSQHIFQSSGLYKPIVVGYDKLYNRGSDYTELNLASGLSYPYISLSGSPRAGLLPPPLTVDFEVETSGILGAYTLYWDYSNGIRQYNNSPTTTTQYALAGDYIPYVRLVDARGIPVTDTLLIGFNR